MEEKNKYRVGGGEKKQKTHNLHDLYVEATRYATSDVVEG
jgi:hypothetical protein